MVEPPEDLRALFAELGVPGAGRPASGASPLPSLPGAAPSEDPRPRMAADADITTETREPGQRAAAELPGEAAAPVLLRELFERLRCADGAGRTAYRDDSAS